MSRLQEKYRNEVVPALMKRFGYSSVMQVPRLVKVVLNMGVGEAAHDPKELENAMRDLSMVTGQKPAVARARKSVAAFKIREGMPIGCYVTLRGRRMYDFLDKFIHLALPQIRDFRGVSPHSFDGRGNYSIGLREQLVFPEMRSVDVDKIRGLDVTIVTTARNDEEAYELLKELGMPFQAA